MISIDQIQLKKGNHTNPEDGRCFMEAVAWLAKLEHSDYPACVCPVLGKFLRVWNDGLNNEDRQKLKPYVRLVIGTAGDGYKKRRSRMALDWLIREHLPAFLELMPDGQKYVKPLRELPELTTHDLSKAWPLIDAAGAAARAAAGDAARAAAGNAAWDAAAAAAGAAVWDAAGAAAGDAAWAAAGDASRAAAGDAAWAAARAAAGAAAGAAAWAAAGAAAGDAAWAAAGAAAGDAAGDAAWAAARAAAGAAAGAAAWAAAGAAAGDAARAAARAAAEQCLRPTVERLQLSAFGLLDRMLLLGLETREMPDIEIPAEPVLCHGSA